MDPGFLTKGFTSTRPTGRVIVINASRNNPAGQRLVSLVELSPRRWYCRWDGTVPAWGCYFHYRKADGWQASSGAIPGELAVAVEHGAQYATDIQDCLVTLATEVKENP